MNTNKNLCFKQGFIKRQELCFVIAILMTTLLIRWPVLMQPVGELTSFYLPKVNLSAIKLINLQRQPKPKPPPLPAVPVPVEVEAEPQNVPTNSFYGKIFQQINDIPLRPLLSKHKIIPVVNPYWHRIEIPPSPKGGFALLRRKLSYIIGSLIITEAFTIVYRFLVKPDGSVSDIETIGKVSDKGINKRIKENLMQNTWYPGMQGGLPVTATVEMPIRFEIPGLK